MAIRISNLPQNKASRFVTLERIEWILAVVLTAAVLFLLIARVTHVGALWRDECDSVQLAEMSLGDLIANLQFSSFPVLFSIIIRGYTAIFGASDFSLRCFGLAVGVGLIAAAWAFSLSARREPPLILLALIGLNANVLISGTWIRGYGIGGLLIIVAMTITVCLQREITSRRLFALLLVGLAASQCLFFDGILMPAILLPLALILFARREFKASSLIIGIGLVIAIAYLPYILNVFFKVRRWAIILNEPASFNRVLKELDYASGTPSYFTHWVWLILITGGIGASVWRLRHHESGPERAVLLLGLTTTILSIGAYAVFMFALHRPPLQRYYVALFCVLACVADLLVATLSRFTVARVARIALVLALTAVLPIAAWPLIIMRETNMDVLAQRLEKEAAQNDLIVVNTWSRGLSFNRYYHGDTRWMTVPQISDHRVHRYDLVQAKMTEFFPLGDLEESITSTLKNGNRVWFVGEFREAVKTTRPIVLAPAPDPQYGWKNGIYSSAWAQQLFMFVRSHAQKIDVVVQPEALVNPNENSALIVAEGWQ